MTFYISHFLYYAILKILLLLLISKLSTYPVVEKKKSYWLSSPFSINKATFL